MAKTYDTYKDSGIKWLGTIPANWRIEKGKHVLSVLSKPVLQDDDVVTCFRDGEVVLRNERRTEGFTMSDKEIGYQHIDKGDIVIHGMDGFAGSIGISKSTGKGSPVLVVCNPIKDNPSYLVYYLRILANTNVFLALSTGIRQRSCDLKWNKISVLPFPLPSLAEQRTITTFLDEKCSEIDSLISLQEKMISELQAYKQSVITEAVTKGLDSNVPMKDSGVEWIGMIPEEWSIDFLSKIIWLRARLGWKGLKAEEYVEEGFPFLSAFNIVNNKLKWEGLNFISKERYDESPEIKLSIGDVLIVKDGAGIGKTARIDQLPKGEATVNSSLGVITPSEKLDYKYLHYFLLSNSFQNIIGFIKNGMGVPHLTQENMKSVLITTPPLSEQQAIASYLDEKTSQIDSLIALKQEKITELKDYKKSIIYEYVTGKKKV